MLCIGLIMLGVSMLSALVALNSCFIKILCQASNSDDKLVASIGVVFSTGLTLVLVGLAIFMVETAFI